MIVDSEKGGGEERVNERVSCITRKMIVDYNVSQMIIESEYNCTASAG